MKKTNVLVADDHSIVREGIINILQTSHYQFHIQEVADFQAVRDTIQQNRFEILITDIQMPKGNIIETIRFINDHAPQTKILVLSMYPEDQYAPQLLRTGAKGYLSKNSVKEDLIDAVNTLLRDEIYVSKQLAGKIASNIVNDQSRPIHDVLSPREFEVFLALAKGVSIKEIAYQLNLSSKTITTFRSRILEKMHFENNAELIRYAIEHQLI